LISSRHDRDGTSNGSVCLLQLPDSWKIYPDDDNISGLSQALSGAGGHGKLLYAKNKQSKTQLCSLISNFLCCCYLAIDFFDLRLFSS
jgi:hypothetical protein